MAGISRREFTKFGLGGVAAFAAGAHVNEYTRESKRLYCSNPSERMDRLQTYRNPTERDVLGRWK